MPYDDCPNECTHETFHYCNEAGTHCDTHCICPCASCEADRKGELSGWELEGSGGRILGDAIVLEMVEIPGGHDSFAGFLTMISKLGLGGAHIVPPADAEDIRNGAVRIPDIVTDLRRLGHTVPFVQQGSRQNWYWVLPSNEIIYHG